MAGTGITWGAWSLDARLGVEYRYDDIGAGTTQSHAYADVYYGTNGRGFDGNYTLVCGFGNVAFHFYSPTGGYVTTLIHTYDLGLQNTSYSGGPSWTCAAGLNAVLYNGANPSLSVGFTLPARPASPPDPPSSYYDGLSSSGVHIYLGAPANTNGAGIDAYETYLLTNNAWPGSGGNVVASAATFGVYATGLTRATTYYYTGRAHNSAGWSGWAAMQVVTTSATVPDAPGAPAVSAVGPVSATVSFTLPGDGGSAITDTAFALYDAPTGGSPVALDGSGSPVTSWTFTGLTPSKTYYAGVWAMNAVGSGTGSARTSFTTLPAVVVGVGGAWVNGIPYVGVGGVWRVGLPYVGVGGVWQQ